MAADHRYIINGGLVCIYIDIFLISTTQMRTMVLEYLPTKLAIFGVYVGTYSSTVEHRGYMTVKTS